jgi:hypothetical protein
VLHSGTRRRFTSPRPEPTRHDHRLVLGLRPPSNRVSEDTVEAVGAESEALEWVERAGGQLYSFHQLTGHADLLLREACEKLRSAGHDDLVDRLRIDRVGRNALYGR